MADFKKAISLVFVNEGSYSNDSNDPGGETYKGISRNNWSKWEGWSTIDLLKIQNNFPSNLSNNVFLQESVERFYEINFWDKFQGDLVEDQKIAEAIFDFAVNAGISTSVSLAQLTVQCKPDGILGPKTLESLNLINQELFLALFTIGKIARYIHIVKKRPSSRKYFYGWTCRTLGEN